LGKPTGVLASWRERPDNKRLVEIWNRLSGVKPVTKFANRKAATDLR
jgi:hypothetical protein